jgi:hypothetical protein
MHTLLHALHIRLHTYLDIIFLLCRWERLRRLRYSNAPVSEQRQAGLLQHGSQGVTVVGQQVQQVEVGMMAEVVGCPMGAMLVVVVGSQGQGSMSSLGVRI